MTDEQLQQIEQRANAATPGPWGASFIKEAGVVLINGTGFFARGALEVNETDEFVEVWTDEDLSRASTNANFIAHARDDVPALVAEVRRLEGERKGLLGGVNRLKGEIAELAAIADAQSFQLSSARDSVERIGRERDDMSRANADLQARLSALEDDLK